MRYSAAKLFWQGLTGNRGWAPAWRDPEPQREYDIVIVDENYSSVLLASGVLVVIGLLTTSILIKIKLKSADAHAKL